MPTILPMVSNGRDGSNPIFKRRGLPSAMRARKPASVIISATPRERIVSSVKDIVGFSNRNLTNADQLRLNHPTIRVSGEGIAFAIPTGEQGQSRIWRITHDLLGVLHPHFERLARFFDRKR